MIRTTLDVFVTNLAAKVPTPGGGAAAAVAGALGAASGAMACAYTTRKKDIESGVAGEASILSRSLADAAMRCLQAAEDDADVYSALQSTWKKDCTLTDLEIKNIQQNALLVPANLVKLCHIHCRDISEFIPKCNPGIVSDAKVAVHLLAGAARAAYQTVLVNKPGAELDNELKAILQDISEMENKIIKEN